jgi:hypothetical protein
VAGARVEYRPRRKDNPFYRRDVLELFTQINVTTSDADGSFQVALLPGPGHLLVKGPTPEYLHVETSYHEMESGKPGGQRYHPDALLALDLQAGAAPAEVAVKLRRGVTVKGRVLRPDGKPVAEGVAMCRSYLLPWSFEFGHTVLVVQDGDFELPGCDPEKAQPVFFLDVKGQLGAVVELSGKQAGEEPVTVRLAACGAATARFVDQDGKPWANQPVGDWPLFVHLVLVVRPGATVWAMPGGEELQSDGAMMVNFDPERYGALRTDAQGRVTFPTLLPGGTFRLWTGEGLGAVKKEFTVKPGQTLDLGDVAMKRTNE